MNFADKTAADLSPVQKVAVLLIALGEETAGEIVRYLDDDEAERIAQAIAEMQSVPAELIDDVLLEFETLLRSGRGLDRGGADVARTLLEQTVGDERAKAMMSQIAEKKNRGFYMLRHSSPDELTQVLQKERPQTIAVVLAQLDPDTSALVFDGLPETVQPDVAFRMANLTDISPDALAELERGIAAELKDIVSGPATRVGGVGAVADMLGRVGRATESSILDRIDVVDPETAEEIRNRMVTFDSLAQMPQQQVQSVIREVDNQDLALALKAAPEKTANAVYGAMSQRASARLKEDVEFLGRARRSEVDEAQQRIARVIRALDETGQVTVLRGDDTDPYVE